MNEKNNEVAMDNENSAPFSIDDIEIVELEDRLELASRCNFSCGETPVDVEA